MTEGTTDKGPRPPRTPTARKFMDEWHPGGRVEGQPTGYIGKASQRAYDDDLAMFHAIEAEVTVPDAGLREALEGLANEKGCYCYGMPHSERCLAARAALAAHAAPAGPAVDVDRLEQVVSDIGEKMPWLLDRAKGMPNESRVLVAEIVARLTHPDEGTATE